MIPGNLLGLVLFLAAVAPGYVFIRTSERFRTMPDRSALLEAAELLVIGAACTTLVGLTAVALAEWVKWATPMLLDVETWAEEGNDYLRGEPYRLARSMGFVLLGASAVAYVAARVANRGTQGDLIPGSTVWRDVFAPASKKGKRGWVGAHLKNGTVVEGYLWSYPTGASDAQAIGLQSPIAFTGPDHPRALVRGIDGAIIDGSEIAMIACRVEPDDGAVPDAST